MLFYKIKKTRQIWQAVFDKHGLILIIFGKKQQQHTFKNNMHI